MSAKAWAALLAFFALLSAGPPGGVLPPEARGAAPPLAAGVHAPNRQWIETDFQRVADAQIGAVKLLSSHSPADFVRLRQDQPGIQLVVRLMTPWNELPPPEQFAAQQAPYLRALVRDGIIPWVEIGNEPNLELHPNAAGAFDAWYSDVLDRLRAAVPEARYGYPGLARDRGEGAWWDVSAAVIARSDWLGVHAYWRSEREMLDPAHALRLMGLHARFPDLPILVTEAGNDRPGVSAAQRAAEYGRFVRTVARLPYVRSVYFFILSGTPEWQRFFLDDAALAALAAPGRSAAPVLDGLLDSARALATAAGPLLRTQLGHHAPAPPLAPPAPTPDPPSPAPAPFARRALLVDHSPAPSLQWLSLPGAPTVDESGVSYLIKLAKADPLPSAASALRSASTFLGTDFSARLTLPAPTPGSASGIQLAEGDLWPAAISSPGGATGFGLLWDGAGWRLQYHRDGGEVVDAPIAMPSTGGSALRVELALERRSAAAWVWPAGSEQPEAPGAVFAPPREADLDGARPRALFIPAGASDVVLEGGTRD